MASGQLAGMLLLLPGILAGLTVHEFSHAFTAISFGDATPRDKKRYTLNPVSHIDPVGFLLLMFAGFGWAKPVPVNPQNFKNPRSDSVIVSLAGPFSNLMLAFLAAFVLKIILVNTGTFLMTSTPGIITRAITESMIRINLALAIFNMIPIPPLDGSHILLNLLPDSMLRFKLLVVRYGSFLLIGLLIIDLMTPGYNVFPLFELVKSLDSGLKNIFGISFAVVSGG